MACPEWISFIVDICTRPHDNSSTSEPHTLKFKLSIFLLALVCAGQLCSEEIHTVAPLSTFRSQSARDGNIKLYPVGPQRYARSFNIEAGRHRVRVALNKSNAHSFGASRFLNLGSFDAEQSVPLVEKGKGISFDLSQRSRLNFEVDLARSQLKIRRDPQYLSAGIRAPQRVAVNESFTLDALDSILPPGARLSFSGSRS